MYSTLDGAKKRAKTLCHLFEKSGILFPLNKCQDAIAAAGGYRNWGELNRVLFKSDRACDSAAFQSRLLSALPLPCRQPVLAWLQREERKPFDDMGARPPNWVYDVMPYVTATMFAHHRHTQLLRIGSGPGQRLRARLLMDRLTNMHDGRNSSLLDPETLDLVYQGRLEDMFQKDFQHANFSREFKRLQEAKVFSWSPDFRPNGIGELRVHPPKGHELMDEILRRITSLVKYWKQAPDSGNALRDYLRETFSQLGIPQAAELADTLVGQNAATHSRSDGVMQDFLSKLAREDDLANLSRAYAIFIVLDPDSANDLKRSIPAKVAANYFGQRHGVTAAQMLTFQRLRPGWEQELIGAAQSPELFARLCADMATDILSPPKVT